MARFAGTQMSNFLGGTMDYSGISGTSMEGRSLGRKATMAGEAEIANAGVKSLGMIKSAGFQADAIEAQGQAAAQASIASGFGSMASGLAGGISSRFGGGRNTGNKTYTGNRGVGQYSLTAPLSTGTNATSKLNSFLSGAHM